jgi:signal transduction histidine kinase
MSTLEAPTQAVIFSKDWRGNFWRRIIAASDSRARHRMMAATVALVVVIGVADFVTGFELSMLVFYLLPVSLGVMTAGWRFGVFIAFASVAAWLGGDIAAGAHYNSPFVPIWNALIVLVTNLVVVWLLASVMALHREMEERVRQRTVTLTDEIAERERLEKALLQISEREQRSIGRDLHDGLGQHLTGTAMSAYALGSKLAARQAPEAEEAHRIVGLIEHGIEQTRGLARGLLLPEIENEGFREAMDDLSATTRMHFRVVCDFTCDGQVNIHDKASASHVYRIAQEAVRNAIRHGAAKKITITVSDNQGMLLLRVRDDGSGLPPPGKRGQGLGLRIMAHRAAIVGATLTVDGLPCGGTLVELRLPNRVAQP